MNLQFALYERVALTVWLRVSAASRYRTETSCSSDKHTDLLYESGEVGTLRLELKFLLCRSSTLSVVLCAYVLKERFELSRYFYHWHLEPARLPLRHLSMATFKDDTYTLTCANYHLWRGKVAAFLFPRYRLRLGLSRLDRIFCET